MNKIRYNPRPFTSGSQKRNARTKLVIAKSLSKQIKEATKSRKTEDTIAKEIIKS